MICISLNYFSQNTYSFSGYSAGQNFTTNSYTFTSTPIANCTSMFARVTHTPNPGWWNLTGANPPNYATYSPGSCGPITGLYLVTDRATNTPVVSLELTFSQPVCGPLTFTIADLNGANLSFRDDVTISAWDQSNVAIPLTTAMVTNNGTGNCNGGAYGTYTHVTGNSLKVVGCSYDDCALDYFTIYSSTKMISKVTIDYASGNADWNGSAITNPDRQWIIVNNVRAFTPCFSLTPNCGPPVSITATQLSGFPPTSGTGLPGGYPNPSISAPSAPTYAWSGTAGTLSVTNPPSLPSTTNITGLGASGGTFTMTGQNNRGCVATKSILVDNSLCVTLPIELLNFDGLCFDNGRNFYWATASEKNNDYFVIQQSKDGLNFKDEFKVTGAGNSTELKTYFARIENRNGNYFRLKQVDFDGKESFSEIIFVDCKEAIISSNDVTASPNPFKDHLTLSLNLDENQELQFNVLNQQGALIHRFSKKFDKGLNEISDFLPENFAKGVYFIKITGYSNNESNTVKVIKL